MASKQFIEYSELIQEDLQTKGLVFVNAGTNKYIVTKNIQLAIELKVPSHLLTVSNGFLMSRNIELCTMCTSAEKEFHLTDLTYEVVRKLELGPNPQIGYFQNIQDLLSGVEKPEEKWSLVQPIRVRPVFFNKTKQKYGINL